MKSCPQMCGARASESLPMVDPHQGGLADDSKTNNPAHDLSMS